MTFLRSVVQYSLRTRVPPVNLAGRSETSFSLMYGSVIYGYGYEGSGFRYDFQLLTFHTFALNSISFELAIKPKWLVIYETIIVIRTWSTEYIFTFFIYVV